MKNNFKVGQKVKISAWEDMEKEFGINCFNEIKCKFAFVHEMKHLCGRIATITNINKDKQVGLDFEDKSGNICWIYSTDMIEPINETIVIYRDKKNQYEVIALDKTTGKKAVAKCSPNNTFDFETGAKLAFERLMTPEPEVTFRVLCVKDYYVGCESIIGFKKGKVYEYINGKCRMEDGFLSRTYNDFSSLIKINKFYEGHLVELKEGDDPKEILKKHDEIKIGDTVKVINKDFTYSCYSYWSGLGKYEQNFVHDAYPEENGKEYKVINMAKHDDFKEMVALIQNPYTTQVFIISVEGIEKTIKE